MRRGHGWVDIMILTPLLTLIPFIFNSMATISVWPFFEADTRGSYKRLEFHTNSNNMRQWQKGGKFDMGYAT